MVNFFKELFRFKEARDLAGFLADVQDRVNMLSGEEGPAKEATLICMCPVCVLAKMYLMHMEATGGDVTKTSRQCLCHTCISTSAGWPEREMPHPECPCPFCDSVQKAMAQSVPRFTVITLGSFDALEVAVDAFMQRRGDVIDERPVEPDETEIDMLTKALMGAFKPAPTQSAAPPKNALPPMQNIPRPKKQDATYDTPEEILAMPNATESKLVTDRQKVDISGKEPPRFETAGTKIILPDGMSPLEAAEWLIKREKDLEQAVSVNEEIDGFPLDAAIALHKALKQTFGWTQMGDSMWNPPSVLTVDTGVFTKTQVAWGEIIMPGIEGVISPCAGHLKGDHQILTLHGQVKKKHRAKIAEVAELARKFLKEESIYKGKAIKPHFPDIGHGEMPTSPKFFDASFVKKEDVVFSKSVHEQIEVSLFTPIRETAACRKYRIPLKRTVLLAGTYGVGKTLTAAITAQLCEENGWTFLLLEKAEDLPDAIEFAKQYQPAAIFVEDVDRSTEGQERTAEIDNILNTIDGVESKGLEIMFVLTTNHAERINKGMMRTGRVDAYIEVAPPDAEAVARLAKVYSRELLADGEDLSQVGKLLAGRKPSDVREAVERSKLAAIFHRGAEAAQIKAEDLVTAANIMQPHFDLMKEPEVEAPSKIEDLLKALVREASYEGPKVREVVAKKTDAQA